MGFIQPSFLRNSMGMVTLPLVSTVLMNCIIINLC